MLRLHMFCAALLAASSVAEAADTAPEIQRAPATPQAVGALHTLRTIPEACARLEGRFTGDAAKPYAFAAVPTSPRCQAYPSMKRLVAIESPSSAVASDCASMKSQASVPAAASIDMRKAPPGKAMSGFRVNSPVIVS